MIARAQVIVGAVFAGLAILISLAAIWRARRTERRALRRLNDRLSVYDPPEDQCPT